MRRTKVLLTSVAFAGRYSLRMKISSSIVCAALSLALPLAAQTAKDPAAAEKPAATPTAPMDKVSYFIGTRIGSDIAQNFKSQGLELDMDNFLQAIRDQFEGKPSKYKEEEMTAAMDAFEKMMVAKQAGKATEAKSQGAKFLAENGKRPEVKTTASGLQYEVLKPAEGAKPAATDTVSVHYHGTFLDGKVFDSSVERKEPATFPLQGVIKGWTEGLQLMNVGSKYKFYIPSDLAYGDEGRPGIPPGSTLVFEVELLKIEK
jgi:FKBP-type peptidyl-prolyl cis-trans isomerase